MCVFVAITDLWRNSRLQKPTAKGTRGSSIICPLCNHFKEKHLIREPVRGQWSPCNSWQGHHKEASTADASHINFQLMDTVALLQPHRQRSKLPRSYLMETWWSSTLSLAFFPAFPSILLSLSLCSDLLAQSYWTVGPLLSFNYKTFHRVNWT